LGTSSLLHWISLKGCLFLFDECPHTLRGEPYCLLALTVAMRLPNFDVFRRMM
jgi:hypothetical protein